MADAPERIWANVVVRQYGRALAGEWNHEDVGAPDDVEYIRADLLEAKLRKARVEALREAEAECAAIAGDPRMYSADRRRGAGQCQAAIRALIEKETGQ